MKANTSTLLLLLSGLLLSGGAHATETASHSVRVPASLTGAVIRMDDGTVISILSPHTAMVNHCDTAEFTYRVAGKSIFIKSMHVVEAAHERYCYRLTGDVSCASPARILITEYHGNVFKGVIMGYFGHDCCGDLTAADCLKCVPITMTLPY